MVAVLAALQHGVALCPAADHPSHLLVSALLSHLSHHSINALGRLRAVDLQRLQLHHLHRLDDLAVFASSGELGHPVSRGQQMYQCLPNDRDCAGLRGASGHPHPAVARSGSVAPAIAQAAEVRRAGNLHDG